MTIRGIPFLICFLAGVVTFAAGVNDGTKCARALHSDFVIKYLASHKLDSADDTLSLEVIVGTLKELLGEGVITIHDLQTILDGQNPLLIRSSSKDLEFRPVLDHLLKAIHLDREHSVAVIQDLFDREAMNIIKRDNKLVETKQRFVRLTFYPIEPGQSVIGDVGKVFEIKDKFWIANFPVTQWQYAKVMGVNPSFFQELSKSSSVEVTFTDNNQMLTKQITMRSNNPVESVPLSKALEFIYRVNELSKLDSPLIYEIIPEHNKHWHYRLPKGVELEFVMRNRGLWIGRYPDGITPENLHRIAWFNENKYGTQPVGLLEPLLVDGKYPLYDLFGNVRELVEDDPFPVYGGGWYEEARNLQLSFRMRGDKVNRGDFDTGFRLVTEPPR